MKLKLPSRWESTVDAVVSFSKWLVYACLIGVLVGAVAAAFHHGIDGATHLRQRVPELIWLLPIAGGSIVLLYHFSDMAQDRGTNLVLAAVREAVPMKLRTAPLIFVSTILTHAVGGSAGREGAALQLGSSLSAYIGRKMKLDAKDHRMLLMCGMAAAFAALFGTPITAALFAMEVVSVGVMYYSALVPCVASAMIGVLVARFFGVHHAGYDIMNIPELSLGVMLQVSILGILCAVLSIVFCKVMHNAPKLYGKFLPDPVLRAFWGGALVLVLTLLVGNQDYNGAGDALIRRMLAGEDIPEAFIMKILFTALTLGAGFRGGEIVPVLCTGAAFGTLMGPILGLSQSFGGALAMTAVFCGATNCPISSILLSYELFGGESLALYALCCGVSYMLSGYYSLYSEQKIVYSKYKTEWVDKKAK